MKVDIQNRHLVELYQKGSSKKYKLPNDVIKKFFMRMQQLEASNTIYDLWKTPALNFERLKGYEKRYSVRLKNKWRLEIEMNWEDKEKTTGTIIILEISNHYGD